MSKRNQMNGMNEMEKALLAGSWEAGAGTDKSIPRRIADMMSWAATQYPGEYCRVEVVFMVMLGIRQKPTKRELQTWRARAGSVRNNLRKYFGCSLVTNGPLGWRATYDDDDIVETSMRKAKDRMGAAGRTLEKEVSLVKTNRLVKRPNKLRLREARLLISKSMALLQQGTQE